MRKSSHVEEKVYRSFFETSLGVGVVTAGVDGLRDAILPFGGATAEQLAERLSARHVALDGESSLTRTAAELLSRYFAGERVSFDLPVAMDGFTPFQQRVYRAVMKIPFGEVMSYGGIARMIGQPEAARGIGGAMARNPLPIIIPCHRVVGSSGKLTGYSAPGGIASKSWLLEMERRAG
jgi:methylated-DNA-[protein]-cysteine S-methyltransferase